MKSKKETKWFINYRKDTKTYTLDCLTNFYKKEGKEWVSESPGVLLNSKIITEKELQEIKNGNNTHANN